MITLLASLAGFISSLIPEIVKYFNDKNDKNHELRILEYQVKLKKQKFENNLDEVEVSASNAQKRVINLQHVNKWETGQKMKTLTHLT